MMDQVLRKRSVKKWMLLMCLMLSFVDDMESLSMTMNEIERVYKYVLYEDDTVSRNFVVVNHDIFWRSNHLGIDSQ